MTQIITHNQKVPRKKTSGRTKKILKCLACKINQEKQEEEQIKNESRNYLKETLVRAVQS